jgi:hypothetical protein
MDDRAKTLAQELFDGLDPGEQVRIAQFFEWCRSQHLSIEPIDLSDQTPDGSLKAPTSSQIPEAMAVMMGGGMI